MRKRLAAASTAIGLVIAALGFVFVARTISREWSGAKDAIGDAGIGWLLASIPVALGGMTLVGVPWRRSMALLGAAPRLKDTLVWYFLGQLGKYVPGTLWPVVGRAELARRGGVARPTAYGSVVLTLGATYLAAMLVVVAFLPFGDGTGGQWWVLLLLPLGLLALNPALLRWGKGVAERVVKREIDVVIPPWRDSVLLVLWHAPAWFVIGTATWLVARAFAPSAQLVDLMVPSVLSWIVGFFFIPAPGGLGVREFAFSQAATSLDDGVGATVAIVSRLVFMSVDALGALGAAVVSGRWRSSPSAPLGDDRAGT
ncbi:MAG TPA: lysylphosphatidylglycerol synthase domain-containing protein [Acidimicrobiales bacterium]|nr:lysylphosphatidylglycerol synthase domain-containing protein [Acidimicrobiales bacterium]